MYAAITDRGDTLPRRNSVRFLGIRLIPGRCPGQHDHFGLRGRHLIVADFLTGGDDHLAACNLHQLGHPPRRADPRIRPCLAVDPHWSALRFRRTPGSSQIPRASHGSFVRPPLSNPQCLRVGEYRRTHLRSFEDSSPENSAAALAASPPFLVYKAPTRSRASAAISESRRPLPSASNRPTAAIPPPAQHLRTIW